MKYDWLFTHNLTRVKKSYAGAVFLLVAEALCAVACNGRCFQGFSDLPMAGLGLVYAFAFSAGDGGMVHEAEGMGAVESWRHDAAVEMLRFGFSFFGDVDFVNDDMSMALFEGCL
jgi:hypothetical protein